MEGSYLTELIKKQHYLNKNRKRNFILILLVPTLILIISFFLDKPKNILSGLIKIIVSSDILLVDYIEIGGLAATLVNVTLVTLSSILMAYFLGLKLNGMLIAAVFMTIGFSFFGKNIVNIWPIYLGGLLYSKIQKIEYKNILVIMLFSTALSPAASEIAFGLGLEYYFSIPLSIFFGLFCGYVITPLGANLIQAHDGYNLYNIGFSIGIIGILVNSLFRSFGINLTPQLIVSDEYDLFFKISLLLFYLGLIALGFYMNGKSFKGYLKLMSYSGKLITDFTQLCGYGLTYINMGIMGLLCMLFVCLTGGCTAYNGAIAGSILAVSGFAAFGKHPKNSIPILIGVYIGGLLKIWEIDSTSFIIAGLFGTALAPITGKFGILAGMIAGFLHLSVSMNVSQVHGGLNLYNNGFSCGLVATVLYPLFHSLRKK